MSVDAPCRGPSPRHFDRRMPSRVAHARTTMSNGEEWENPRELNLRPHAAAHELVDALRADSGGFEAPGRRLALIDGN